MRVRLDNQVFDHICLSKRKLRAAGSDPAAIGRRRSGRVGGTTTFEGFPEEPPFPTSIDVDSCE